MKSGTDLASFVQSRQLPVSLKSSLSNFALSLIASNESASKKSSAASKLSQPRGFTSTQLSILESMSKTEVISITDPAQTDFILQFLKQSGVISEVRRLVRYSIEQSTADPLEPSQWGLDKIAVKKVWSKVTGKGIKVGIVDTGIDFNHEDLSANLSISKSEDLNKNGTFEPWDRALSRNGKTGDLDAVDQDGNGFVDDVIGYDFVNQRMANVGDAFTPDAIPSDENGHGTLVAGIIAAVRGNGKGVIGVAPSAQLLTARAFDASGNGEEDDIASAIVYCALSGCQIINCSFGDEVFSPITEEAIRFAIESGCIVVASSGNNGWDLPHFPSDLTDVISVGSSNEADQRVFNSNYGNRLHLIAPGSGVYSTSMSNSYRKASGTSFAAPHVSGAVALLLEKNPTLTVDEITGILAASCDDVGATGYDRTTGHGRLNVTRAIDFPSAGAVNITSPRNTTTVNRNVTSQILIRGNAVTPRFDYFDLEWGVGDNPEADSSWHLISRSRIQLKADTLGFLPISILPDSVVTIRLKTVLNTGVSLEARSTINVVSKPIRVVAFADTLAWHELRRTRVISVEADRNCRAELRIRGARTFRLIVIQDPERFARNHTFSVGFPDFEPDEYTADLVLFSAEGDTTFQAFSFVLPRESFPQQSLVPTTSTLPDGYLSASIGASSNGETPSLIAVADKVDDRIRIFRRDATQPSGFEPTEDLREFYLPRGFADSDGNGKQELLVESLGSSRVLEDVGGGKGFLLQFPKSTFNDAYFRATGFADVDGDAKPEVVGFDQNSFVVYRWNGNDYSEYTRFTDTTSDRPSEGSRFGAPAFATGDFDSDGTIDAAFLNRFGTLFVVRLSPVRCPLLFLEKNSSNEATRFITAIDRLGNGKLEIVYMIPPRSRTNDGREYNAPIWQLKLASHSAAGGFSTRPVDYFYGYRFGGFFDNGIGASDLDTRVGDELVIGAFPTCYSFVVRDSVFRPLWGINSCNANAFVFPKFKDKDSLLIGFSTGDSITFFRSNPKLGGTVDSESHAQTECVGLTVTPVDSTTATFQWKKIPSAKSYQLFVEEYVGSIPNGAGILVVDTSLAVLDLKKEQLYIAQVVSIDSQDVIGARSVPVLFRLRSAPTIRSAVATGSRTIGLETDFEFSETQTTPSTIGIYNPNRLFHGVISSAIHTRPNRLDVTFPFELIPGKNLLSVNGLVASNGEMFTPTLIEVDVRTADTNRTFSIAAFDILGDLQIRLSFTEPIDSASAVELTKYALSPRGIIESVSWSAESPSECILRLNPDQPLVDIGREYVVSVSRLQASSGRIITSGAGSTVTFLYSTVGSTELFAYPDPVKLGDGDILHFVGLKDGERVMIMESSGRVIQFVEKKVNNPEVVWDCRAQDGRLVGSGVYLWGLVDGANVRSLRKLVVRR